MKMSFLILASLMSSTLFAQTVGVQDMSVYECSVKTSGPQINKMAIIAETEREAIKIFVNRVPKLIAVMNDGTNAKSVIVQTEEAMLVNGPKGAIAQQIICALYAGPALK